MLLLPPLFFLALTAFWWHRHRRLDVCIYMSGLYALVTLLAVVLVNGEMLGDGGILFENSNVHIGVAPTVLFCLAVGMCIAPFGMIYGRDIERITIHSPWLIDAFSLLLLAVSLLNLYLVADSTLDILQGDLGQVRIDHYGGAESPAQLKADSMNRLLKMLYYANVSTILCLPIFFYNVSEHRHVWWWNGALLFASLSCPIVGVQVADRTEIVYWGLMLLFCIIFFYGRLSRGQRWMLAALGVPVVAVAVVYLVAVSQSRFDRGGASDSGARTVQYAGQGFINFCYFYDHANTNYVSAEREFPLLHHYVYHVDSGAERRAERSAQQGFFISVFAGFVGDIMVDIGIVGLALWVVVYFMAAMLLIRCSHRTEWDISEVLLLFLLAVVPLFGIFYYRFMAFTYTFSLIFVVALVIASRVRLRI